MKKKILIASRWFHKYFHIGIAIFKFLREKRQKYVKSLGSWATYRKCFVEKDENADLDFCSHLFLDCHKKLIANYQTGLLCYIIFHLVAK